MAPDGPDALDGTDSLDGPSIDYDRSTALIVVDVQNDFADPDGSLYVEGGDRIIDAVNEHIAAAHDAGAPVFYTQDWHPPETPHFVTGGGTWPVHCVRETWGAQLHPSLQVVEGPVVRKGTGGEDGYSGFTMRDPVTGEEASTGLHEQLQARGVERVVVVGLALDVCVKATALDAVELGYGCEVPLGSSAAVNVEPGDDQRAVAEMSTAGVTVA
jgi:nicotinamidase/pyrazinamidase